MVPLGRGHTHYDEDSRSPSIAAQRQAGAARPSTSPLLDKRNGLVSRQASWHQGSRLLPGVHHLLLRFAAGLAVSRFAAGLDFLRAAVARLVSGLMRGTTFTRLDGTRPVGSGLVT